MNREDPSSIFFPTVRLRSTVLRSYVGSWTYGIGVVHMDIERTIQLNISKYVFQNVIISLEN